MIPRTQIITEARSWVGTRFHHQGRCKKTANDKGGVDCIGLIAEVARAVGYPVEDKTDYGRQPEGSRLVEALQQQLQSTSLQAIQPGDVLVFAIEKDPQHVGIVSDLASGELGLIHAYLEARGVVEHRLDQYWWKKAVAAFSFPSNLKPQT